MAIGEINEQLKAVQISTGLRKLIALDNIWTRVLEDDLGQQVGMNVIRTLAASLEELIDAVPADVDWVRDFVRRHSNQIDASIIEAASNNLQYSKSKRQELISKMSDAKGYSAIFFRLTDSIGAKIYEAKEEIREKTGHLERGAKQPGDMPTWLKCGAKGALAIVLLATPGEELFGGYVAFEVIDECF
jgi:hypothetical protein